MNPLIQLRKASAVFLIALACFGLAPSTHALLPPPPPDGGYPGGNTAEGTAALRDLTTGTFNTALGNFTLTLNTEGENNTAVGSSALRNNTTGDENTAVGVDALNRNTTGIQNTATGAFALFHNTSGNLNNALGAEALFRNTTGSSNNALGNVALTSNTIGNFNNAVGDAALSTNTTGDWNTATGAQALRNNTTGSLNTANGFQALANNTTGGLNTANGPGALFDNSTGSNNIALGAAAGDHLTTGHNNIDIGNGGAAGESDTIRIGATQTRTFVAGISGATVTGTAVVVHGSGQLGVAPSSARFKEAIKSMGNASEALFALKPVTFRYTKDIDPQGISQFGLVAEEVEAVNSDLVVPDKEGKPYTVRYDAVNAMLLNEFLKEHRKVEQMQKQIEALTGALEKVSAQLELSKSAPQVVNNP